MSALVSLTWPADLPEDCPPDTALPADGTYYYIVKNDPPKPEDFVSGYHKNPNRWETNISKGLADRCQTMGISIYPDIGTAIFYAESNRRRIGDKVARVTLTPDAGKILRTPSRRSSNHHTWWKYEEFKPAEHAEVVYIL